MEPTKTRLALPAILVSVTFFTTFLAGSIWVRGSVPSSLAELSAGWVFSVPLMSILLAHEFGHFFAGMYHRVDVSLPYFIPVPLMPGTMGAIIRIRERIRSRNALLDIGAAGPLAGMAVAIPILVYGISTSPIEPIPETDYLVEGRSILYSGLLYAIKGPIPAGYDIMLSPTAFAGWFGLLVTMINLVPFGQLDGGHVGYALFGTKQNEVSRWVQRSLPILGIAVCAAYGVRSYLDGARGDRLIGESTAGIHWLIWTFVLWILTRATGPDHPPTDDSVLSRRRRAVAWLTLSLFVLLFMPTWIRQQ